MADDLPPASETPRKLKQIATSLDGACAGSLATVVTEVLYRLVHRTPVDTGRARGNWELGVGSPDATTDVDRYDQDGSDTIKRGTDRLEDVHPGPDIYITNGLPYIGPLENGWSKKAPEGMINITAAEVPFIIEMVGRGMADRLHGRGPAQGPLLGVPRTMGDG